MVPDSEVKAPKESVKGILGFSNIPPLSQRREDAIQLSILRATPPASLISEVTLN